MKTHFTSPFLRLADLPPAVSVLLELPSGAVQGGGWRHRRASDSSRYARRCRCRERKQLLATAARLPRACIDDQ